MLAAHYHLDYALPGPPIKFQFSLLSLLFILTASAIVLTILPALRDSSQPVVHTVYFAVVTRAPIYLAWLFAGVVAIRRWNRHPSVSKVTLLALVVFLGVSLLSTYGSLYLNIFQMTDAGWSVQPAYNLIYAVAFLESTVHAFAWMLLFGALFGWRQQGITNR